MPESIEANFDRFIANEVVKPLMNRMHQNVTAKNPVKTGASRNSWLIAVGSSGFDIEFSDPVTQRGKQVASLASLQVYTLPQGNIRIYNTAPYINRLNMGHSAQAPSGFIETAIQEAISFG